MGTDKKKDKKKRRQQTQDPYSQAALEDAMSAGAVAYTGLLGSWWAERARDAQHRQAFAQIADWLAARLPADAADLLDYTCGSGPLLRELRRAFPAAGLVGYDGSQVLLDEATADLAGDPQLTLEQKWLPDLGDRRPPVDCTMICFPQLLLPEDESFIRSYRRAHPAEVEAAAMIWENMIENEHWDEEEDDQAFRVKNTVFERICARHCWQLTRPGGHCLRVDYSYSDLAETDLTYLTYNRFAEGWDHQTYGVLVDQLFRLIDHDFVASPVIDDVHAQTGEDSDEGGYTLCLLQRCEL